MKSLVTGAGGQLARAFAAAAPDGWTVEALDRQALDIRDTAAVRAAIAHAAPDLVLNAAAYTAVDLAEREADRAFAVNRDGARNVAEASVGRRLIQISTDYVFDGRQGRPYRPDDPALPRNVYGASKLAGEAAVSAAAPGALIVRTAWLYGAGGANFLTTMLRAMTTRSEVRVVADQIGAPTSTTTLARTLWDLALIDARGLWHYTDAGVASWYDFAQAIAEEAVAAGVLAGAPPVIPIATADWPTAAARPAMSVLDTTATIARLGRPGPHWRTALREVLRAPGAWT